MAQTIKIQKQSLVDWQVTVNNKHRAWIRRDKPGYRVSVKCQFGGKDFDWFVCSFAEATKEVKEYLA